MQILLVLADLKEHRRNLDRAIAALEQLQSSRTVVPRTANRKRKITGKSKPADQEESIVHQDTPSKVIVFAKMGKGAV